MQKAKPVPENKTKKILGDFEIQTDPPILTERQDLVLISKKKRTSHLMDFAISADH